MKKIFLMVLVIITFLLTAAVVFSAEKEENVVVVTSGMENFNDIVAAKNIYVYVTFNNTLLWSDNKTVDEFLKSRKNRGDKAEEDKKVMIKDFYKKFDQNIKVLGKKWNLTRTENPQEIKDGYIIYFNYDKCFPLPGLGAQGYGSISIYKSEDQKKSLLNGIVKSFSLAKSFAHFDPTFQFSEVGQRFAKEITQFLKGQDTK